MSKSNLSKHLAWLLWTRPYLPSDTTSVTSTAVESPDTLDIDGFGGENEQNNKELVNPGRIPGRLDATQDQNLVQSPPARRIDHANTGLGSPDVIGETESNMARLQVAPKSSIKPRLVQSTSSSTSEARSTITTLTDQYHAQFRSSENSM